MSVTRYGINAQGLFTNLRDGGYVSYQDYEKLAAENAGLKDAISCHAAGFTVCEACGEENISGNDDVCRALDETPATDAFLAEVRAQGVEMMASEAEQLMDEFGDDSYIVMVTADLQRFANAFAAQLRKGVQS
ncbi:hypothetical protein [Enterobacter genomosp. S]|uniref:Phage protein n=1 Tax=Enterobacter genomosp. S TaxID=2364151 RepID=A0ABR5YJC5_9ENTR|nr:hypothetical protein [Enterobacter genomosp. S]KZR30415.1 hypothetical protein A3466_07930 [Enterobacter genomosp. S]